MAVEITMMLRIHATFGRVPKKPMSPRAHPVFAIADTGTQIYSAGPEIKKFLGYSDGYLVSTSHRIRGITNDWLRIKGVLFLCIRVGTKVTRQAVYVSDNTSGFYLSQTALKDLNLLPSDFPTSLSQSNLSTIAQEMDPCGYPHRTPVPTKPKTIPFKPIQANRHKLQQWLLEYFKSSAFKTCPH